MKKILLGICVFGLFFACNRKNSAQNIGLVVSTLNNPFFVDLKNGAAAKAKELGYNLIVLDSQNDIAKELANIEDLISRSIGVILINPTDSDSSSKAVQLAIDAGIPVISLDRNINNAQVTGHIASDNAAGGRIAAEYLKEILQPNEKIIELEGIPGTSAARERGKGFHDASKALGLNIANKQTANFDRSQGLTVTENLLQVTPDVKGIFAHNDEMALGAQRAVSDAKLNVAVVGFDATPDAVAAVEAGILAATIAQQPDLIGTLGVENAVKLIRKESIPANIPVELQLIKKH